MSKPPILRTLLAVVALSVGFLAAAPAFSADAAPIKIMPLGDSITGSPGCWRALLWNKLQSTGYTNIDFVGTQPAQGCGVAYDGDGEGHGGALATTTASSGALTGWLSATNPDIVMMHFGTNDVWSNIAPDTILSAFSTLVDQMRANNPNMKILVAQIIPMNPSTCTECAARVVAFNAAIPAWASGKTTARSPITVVDQWTGFDDATDTTDGVHPNDAGNVKISDRWYPALTPLLGGAITPTTTAAATTTPAGTTLPVPTTPPATPTAITTTPVATTPVATTPVTTATTTTPASTSKACTATYAVAGQWPGGFQGQVTVQNTGSTAITGWTVTLTFPSGQTITQLWSGVLTLNGSTATITNAAWNGSLAVGGTTVFGFIGTWTGSNAVPTGTCSAS